MHEYATNVDRKTIPIALAVVAIVAALGVNALIQKWMLQIPWWLDAPSLMGFYGILYLSYDKVLWRVRLGPLALSKIPYVGGVWAGVLTSSHNNGTKINIAFYIDQTWSKIAIRTDTVTSTSYTTMAALYTEEYLDPGLKYEYLSEPGAFAKETMHIHRGTGHLRLSPDGKTVTGEYYTGRDRRNFGTLELHFVSKKKISREEALKHLTPEQVSTGS